MIKKSTMIVVVVFSFFQLSTSVIEAESKDELTDAQIKELGKEDPKIIKEKHASSNDEGKEELEKSQESSISDEDADLFKPYQIGDQGDRIIQLKRDLTSLGYGKFSEHPSQHYDSETEDVVKKFQLDYDLNETGIADKDTLEKIEEVLSTFNQESDIDDSEETEEVEDEDPETAKEAGPSEEDSNAPEEGKVDEKGDSETSGGIESDEGEDLETSEDTEIDEGEKSEAAEEDELNTSQDIEPKKDKKHSFTVSSFKSTSLKKGVRDPKVIELKNNLNKLGYGGITVTNYYGSFTEKRVKQFQEYYSLKVTGEPDQATLSKIASLLPNPLSQGKRHKDTIPLKKDLNKLGYGGITVTNYFGSFTEKRVKQFQEYYGLKATGEADEATLSKIASLLPNPLSQGKRHKDTIPLKKDLNKLGYGGITVTNYFGSFTKKRVKQFQNYYGLKVTGEADQATLSKIASLLPNPLSQGKRHKDTIPLKKDLNKLGYGGITVTNYFGSFTEKRVKQFQEYYGLKVTGEADQATLSKIASLLPNPLSQGKRHKDTIPLKKDLNKLGYGGITVTNYFGSFTEKRVKQFQNYYGLKVTGEADQATLSKIASLLPNPLSQGKRHKDTIPLKKDLNKLGYGGITVTNYYGSFTEKRVKQFQEYYGLKVTGEADQATLSKIASLLPNPLSKGKRHKDTIPLKRDLNKLDYGGITVTNYYGSFTEKRVKQFQEYYGLKVTGEADQATLSKIASLLPNPLSKGKRHKNTIPLKKKLNEIGYGGITVTNYYGSFTEKRVKEFQKDYGLPVTGIADAKTLATIEKAMETREVITYSKFNISLEEALNIQMNQLQQTDKYRNLPAYVSANYVEIKNGVARTTVNLNVRAASNTGSHIYDTIPKGTKINITKKGNTWHEISFNTWRNPTRVDVKYHLNPNNNDPFQHLDLSESASVSAWSLNNVLQGKGVLQGLGQAFINGGKQHSINEIYLISHALLETGHGTSKLASGIEVGKNKSGKLVLVTSSNRSSLTNIKTTYNMFGIGAADSDPNRLGAIRAYNEGWFTPEAAVRGGAKFIGNSYIHNSYNQNTLYKMRWNPANPGYPQYATDIGWAVKQVTQIKNMYNLLNNPLLKFNIVQYL